MHGRLQETRGGYRRFRLRQGAILFFAHRGYTIRTRSLRVEGNGGEYRLSQENTAVAGTQITVELDDDSCRYDDWRERIEAYAPPRVSWSTPLGGRSRSDWMGRILQQDNDSTYDFYLQTPLGTVWYNEEPDSCRSEFVISVCGLPMFIRDLVFPEPIRVPWLAVSSLSRAALY